MPGVIRPLVLATALVTAFAAPASAAPTWLAPKDLSVPPASGTPSGSEVASDAANETFATWLQTDGTNVRVQIATHAPGQPWSAASNLSDAAEDAGPASLALSSTGYGAIAWTRSDGAHVRVQVSRRAPGGAFGPADTISTAGVDAAVGKVLANQYGPFAAVDATGDVVVVWEDSVELNLFARRYSASTGTWGTILPLATVATTQEIEYPTVAMSPSGVATAAWSIDDDTSATIHYQVQTSTQAANGTWPAGTQVSSTPAAYQSAVPQLAVDAAGNVTLVWVQYKWSNCTSTACTITGGEVFAATRPAVSGIWQPAQDLSDPLVTAGPPVIATTPAGEVTVAWTEGATNSLKVETRPVGGSFPGPGAATIIAPQDQPIEAGYALSLPITTVHLAAGPASVIVTFARSNGTNYLAEAVIRTEGSPWPDPSATPPTALSAPGTDIGFDGPSVTLDGQGNAVATWTRGTTIQSAAFDATPPGFVAASIPATATTGQPVAFSASTLDTWSALGAGQPSWSFGDSTTGAGSSVTHTYSAPGTYTVTLGASDAVGNAATPVTRQIAVTSPVVVPPPTEPIPPATVAQPKLKLKLKATWKLSRLTGSVSLAGTAGADATLTAAVRMHGKKKTAFKSTFKVKKGTWTRSLELPAGLAPGSYDVFVSGPGVASSQMAFTLAAPISGIVRRSYASGSEHGPAATVLRSTSELWAHFVFGTLPKRGQGITTQWLLPHDSTLPTTSRPRTSLIEARVDDRTGNPLPTGRWRCVIKVGNVVVAILSVRLK